jgi:radical SAM protein with 4Fe4S-binding SPASM domain
VRPAPLPPPPSYVQVYVTLRCDRSCEFCFNRGIASRGDFDPAAFALMLDRLRSAGVDAVDLIGGEPTLHPRLGELLRAVRDHGMRATLSTNGRDPGLLERIADEVGPDVLRVGVSLNDDGIPESVRGHVARRAPMVKSVCGRERDFPAPVEELLAAAAAPRGWLIYRDALEAADLASCLPFPEYLERLEAARRRLPGVGGVWCGGFLPDLEVAPALAGARCPAGTTKLSVLPDGSAWPCYLLFRREEFRLGNLVTDPFEDAWGHPGLAFFRTFRGNACPERACRLHAACHGGCPAVSLALAGSLEAPDPRCRGAGA